MFSPRRKEAKTDSERREKMKEKEKGKAESETWSRNEKAWKQREDSKRNGWQNNCYWIRFTNACVFFLVWIFCLLFFSLFCYPDVHHKKRGNIDEAIH